MLGSGENRWARRTFAGSTPCVAWQEDHFAHLTSKSSKKNKSNEKHRAWIEQAPPDGKNHAYFQLAATADCVACIKYWLEQGQDPRRGTEEHPEWDAIAWAKWANARNVLPLLESASREGSLEAEKSERTFVEPEEMDDGGVWESEAVIAHADLEPFIDVERHRNTWRGGLAGDWKDVYFWCQVRCGDPMSLFVFRSRERLPYRLYYWSWLHFIQLASLCVKGKDDEKNLIKIKDLLWAREKEQVIRTMDFILHVMPGEDNEKHEFLIDLLRGKLRFKQVDVDSESRKQVQDSSVFLVFSHGEF